MDKDKNESQEPPPAHQQSPPFSKVGAGQRTLRRGLILAANIFKHIYQLHLVSKNKMNGQKQETGKTREKKIEAIYLSFLRILVISDAYDDGMGDISSRHLSVSRQTLPDIANPGTV